MPRLVHSRAAAGDYAERVAKYVPIEVIGAYLTLQSVASATAAPLPVHVGLYAVLLIVTPIYLLSIDKTAAGRKQQALIGTGAFVIWTYGIGGTFFWGAMQQRFEITLMYPLLQAGLLVVWTAIVGLYKPQPGIGSTVPA